MVYEQTKYPIASNSFCCLMTVVKLPAVAFGPGYSLYLLRRMPLLSHNGLTAFFK
jgi:hypothetical protein